VAASKRAETTVCETLGHAGVVYVEWTLQGRNLEKEINQAQKIHKCVVILSGRDGGRQIGIIWTDERNPRGGTFKHEVRIDVGLRHLISQLGGARTANGDVGATESGWQRPAVGMRRNKSANEIVHQFAAVLVHGLGAHTKKSVPKRKLDEAVKSSAKLISSYIFKELSDDNSTAGTKDGTAWGWSTVEPRRAGAAASDQRWRRQGQRQDPMIPSNAEAWPALRKHLGATLTRWWGSAAVTPKSLQATVDQLLGWCRDGSKAVEEEARRGVLPAEWTDLHTKVLAIEASGAGAPMMMRCGDAKPLQIDVARYQRLQQLYDRHMVQQQQQPPPPPPPPPQAQGVTTTGCRCSIAQVNTRSASYWRAVHALP
jgi:hypothetical protein